MQPSCTIIELEWDQAVEVSAEGKGIVVEPIEHAYTLDDLLNGITAENQHAEFNFDITQGQEQL